MGNTSTQDIATPFSIVTKTTTYTVVASDYIVKGDTTGGAFTITLPTAVGIAGSGVHH